MGVICGDVNNHKELQAHTFLSEIKPGIHAPQKSVQNYKHLMSVSGTPTLGTVIMVFYYFVHSVYQTKFIRLNPYVNLSFSQYEAVIPQAVC